MATNLRLRPDAESALRAESERSGRSQQDLIRDAVDRFLGGVSKTAPPGQRDSVFASGVARQPRLPLTRPTRRIMLPAGATSAGLLDRDDRI